MGGPPKIFIDFLWIRRVPSLLHGGAGSLQLHSTWSYSHCLTLVPLSCNPCRASSYCLFSTLIPTVLTQLRYKYEFTGNCFWKTLCIQCCPFFTPRSTLAFLFSSRYSYLPKGRLQSQTGKGMSSYVSPLRAQGRSEPLLRLHLSLQDSRLSICGSHRVLRRE